MTQGFQLLLEKSPRQGTHPSKLSAWGFWSPYLEMGKSVLFQVTRFVCVCFFKGVVQGDVNPVWWNYQSEFGCDWRCFESPITYNMYSDHCWSLWSFLARSPEADNPKSICRKSTEEENTAWSEHHNPSSDPSSHSWHKTKRHFCNHHLIYTSSYACHGGKICGEAILQEWLVEM